MLSQKTFGYVMNHVGFFSSVLMELILKDIPLLHNPNTGLGGLPLSSNIFKTTIFFCRLHNHSVVYKILLGGVLFLVISACSCVKTDPL